MYRSGSKGFELARLMLVVFASLLIMSLPTPAIATGGDIDSSLFSKFQANRNAAIVEVSPPEIIQELRPALSSHQPQVEILSPKTGQVVEDNAVSVKLQVEDLPLFQNSDLGLGPHLLLLVDDQPRQAIYDVQEPISIEDLKPGTHTLRALALYPWLESFKNPRAYAEVTFHVFTKTLDNQPIASQPLLTYNQPQDIYGTEPVMLDFYVSGLSASDTDTGSFSGQVRVTVNDNSFLMESWKTLYLKGLNPGKNWVRLELLDQQGDAIANAYNDTVHLIDLQPDGQDSLAQIVRGDLNVSQVRGIVDPDYTPPIVEADVSESIVEEVPELNNEAPEADGISEEAATLNLQPSNTPLNSEPEEQSTLSLEIQSSEGAGSFTEQDNMPLESETPLSQRDFEAVAE